LWQADDPREVDLPYEKRGTRNLLTAARLTDSIVEWMLLVGPAELHYHCPELTLTMAAMERTLFSYMEILLLHGGGGRAGSYTPNAATPAVTLHGIAAALERALPAMESDRAFARPRCAQGKKKGGLEIKGVSASHWRTRKKRQYQRPIQIFARKL